VGTVVVTCPANAFSIPVEPGSYLVRVNLPLDRPRGQLPQRWLESGTVTVDAGDVVKDVHVLNGLRLAGRATINGSTPLAGVSVNAAYSDLGNLVSAFGVSGSDGSWRDGFFSSPWLLQAGIRFTLSGCQTTPAPGIKEIIVSPDGPILYPTESDRLDCDFVTGDALRYTHRATRLKLTSFPGDIGGLSQPIIFPDLGFGYSAQFPLPAGEAPRPGPDPANRQLFRGGLVLGVSEAALSGIELGDYVACRVSPCRALGFDGEATITEGPGSSKQVSWLYTDAGSQRPRGLRVQQRSFDGKNGADYVIYGFRITNQSTAAITFAPGVFLDFDVSPDFSRNIGYAELGGRLMITAPEADIGSHFGSVIVEDRPANRSFFFTGNSFLEEDAIVAALRGEISNPSSSEPSDVRMVQGGNTVKLGRGKSADFWVAIVAGDDRAQTIVNAQAAIADVTERRRQGDPFSASAENGIIRRPVSAGARAGAVSGPGRICKAGCGDPERPR
jgi:hypothetical protein